MKKSGIILACMLICFGLFSGCTDDKDDSDSDMGLGNAVDVDIDAAAKGDTDISIGDGDIVFDFKDSENADGIVASPKE